MTSSKFDKYSNDYQEKVDASIAFSGLGTDIFVRVKALILKEAMRKLAIPAWTNVLDVGCGIGLIHRELHPEVERLAGVDVSSDSLAQAKSRNPDYNYIAYDGSTLPFADNSFSLAFTSCVLHHVMPTARSGFIRELYRVVTPGGAIGVIEHNPINPLTRLAVARCEFDDDAILTRASRVRQLIFEAGFRSAETHFFAFSPFCATSIGFECETLVRWLPLGAQYLVHGVK